MKRIFAIASLILAAQIGSLQASSPDNSDGERELKRRAVHDEFCSTCGQLLPVKGSLADLIKQKREQAGWGFINMFDFKSGQQTSTEVIRAYIQREPGQRCLSINARSYLFDTRDGSKHPRANRPDPALFKEILLGQPKLTLLKLYSIKNAGNWLGVLAADQAALCPNLQTLIFHMQEELYLRDLVAALNSGALPNSLTLLGLYQKPTWLGTLNLEQQKAIQVMRPHLSLILCSQSPAERYRNVGSYHPTLVVAPQTTREELVSHIEDTFRDEEDGRLYPGAANLLNNPNFSASDIIFLSKQYPLVNFIPYGVDPTQQAIVDGKLVSIIPKDGE